MRPVPMLLLAGAVSLSLSMQTAAGQEDSAPGGRQAEVVDITSIELIRGYSEDQFTLLVRCDSWRETNWFWVHHRTFVLDIRQAYMPFRGQALGQLLLSQVTGVRASQFMEGLNPIARVEIDLIREKGIEVRWTSEGIEVMFTILTPALPSTAPTGRPGGGEPGPGTEPPVTETPVTEPPVTEPPVTEPPVTEPPVTEPPVTETPVTETPVTEPPDTTGQETVPPVSTRQESTVTEVPTGRELPYRPGSRVNPFDPLLKPLDDTVDLTNTLTRPLPNAEQLQLTGITWQESRPDESVALLRDGEGRNYLLMKGDRVKYGYVSHVGEREIIFVLDIFGRHKVVTLKYNP